MVPLFLLASFTSLKTFLLECDSFTAPKLNVDEGSILTFADVAVGVGVGVRVAVAVGVLVGVGVAVSVDVAVLLGVAVAVRVEVLVGVGLELGRASGT